MNTLIIIAILVLVFVLLYMLFNTGSSSKSLEPPVVTAPRPETVSAKPVVAAAPSVNKVTELNTGDETKEFLEKGEPGLLLVYAPWCGHCRMMMPDFEAASNETTVRFARLDGAKAQDFMREKEIRGFPTIFTVNAKGVERYMGGRDKASLLSGAAALL